VEIYYDIVADILYKLKDVGIWVTVWFVLGQYISCIVFVGAGLLFDYHCVVAGFREVFLRNIGEFCWISRFSW